MNKPKIKKMNALKSKDNELSIEPLYIKMK